MVSNSVQLYRHLLKCIRKLPPDAQGYYRRYVVQGYINHKDETDPERIQQIIDRAVEDAKWIVEKYSKPQEKKT